MTTQPNWQPLVIGIVIPARPAGIWTRAVDYILGPRKIKISVNPASIWTLSLGTDRGPDGDPTQPQNLNQLPLLTSAPIGALIGKVGGSAADNTAPVISMPNTAPILPANVPTAFSVGSFCIFELSNTQRGSLFLTMNDAAAAFTQHSGQLLVDIFEAL